jgi:hypothetical protein
MVEGRRREQWDHTANLLAQLTNPYRGEDQDPLMPSDFHPMPERLAFAEAQAKRRARQNRAKLRDFGAAKGQILKALKGD